MNAHSAMSKVPAVTLGFWIIKIAATTLGETGGDTVTMTLNWGYLAGTALFLGLLVGLVAAQIRSASPALSLLGDDCRFHHLRDEWRTSPTARWASVMPAARRFC